MVGQEKLLAKLNSYSINNLPKALLLLGEEGCGKHTVAKLMAANLHLPVVEPKEIIAIDDLIEFAQDPIAKLYIINLNEYTEKQQNRLLKFIEEPGKNIYIVLLATSEIGVLQTILNRCVRFHFEPYTTEQLKQIKSFNTDLVYKVCRTPGQLISANEKCIIDLYTLCKKLPNCLQKASYPNTLAIETRLNYGEEYDKIDFNLFFNMILYAAYEDYLATNNPNSLKVYTFTCKFRQQLANTNLVKENFVINYLTNLWETMRLWN